MARSNISPKALNKSIARRFEELLEAYKKFLKGEGIDKNDTIASVFAGRTGIAHGGRFNRIGSGSLAVLFDVGVKAEPAGPVNEVVEIGGTVGVEGDIGKGWGHSGDAAISDFTQAFVVAVPWKLLEAGRIDVAQTLMALASAPLNSPDLIDKVEGSSVPQED